MFFKNLTKSSKFLNTPKTINVQKAFKHDVAVNLKFVVKEDQSSFVERVTKTGTFISEHKNEDVYYDVVAKDSKTTYDFTKKDIWLRKRNGNWECKVPQVVEGLSHVGKDPHYNTPIYTQAIGELAIRKELNLQPLPNTPPKSLDQDLEERNITPFAIIKSTMKVFSVDKGINLWLETSDFGYQYGIVRSEQSNAEEEQVEILVQKFEKLVGDLKLDVVPHARDLIAEYLFRNSPAHYKVLLDSKVLVDASEMQKQYEKLKKGGEKPEGSE